MKAVFALLRVYFLGTAWQRWITVGLGAMIVAGVVFINWVARSFLLQWICFAGCALFFVGSALMPKIFGQLARSHTIHSVRFGRLKLLASAFLTTAIVSLPLPILSALTARISYSRILLDPNLSFLQRLVQFVQLEFLWNLIVNVFLFSTFMYVALWFLTTSRTTLGKVLTILITIVLLTVPIDFASLNPDAPIASVVIVIAAFWLVFSVFILCAPRLPSKGDSLLTRLANRARSKLSFRASTAITLDKSLGLLLGIGNPWTLAAAIVLCVALDTVFVSTLSAWLVFLAILAIVSSAIAGLVTTRSRVLWLRQPWSRTELFLHIESMLWRRNAIALSVLIATFVVVGSYVDRSMAILALGLPLIVLSAAASLYLSLLQTRGLQWMESILAIITTLTIMTIAVLAAGDESRRTVTVSLLALLTASTFIFRALAKRRWSVLDWTLCRGPVRNGVVAP